MKYKLILIIEVIFIAVLTIGYFILIQKNRHLPPPEISFNNSHFYSDNQSEDIPNLTLDTVFEENKNLPTNDLTTIIATGDVMLGRYVNLKATELNDFTYLFNNFIPILSAADISVINLESPLSDNCPITAEGMVFCANTNHVEGLLKAGVDIANIANNHAWDQKEVGLNKTIQKLSENDILITGLSQPVFKTTKDSVYSFLGYNLVNPKVKDIAWGTNENVISDIIYAKEKSDIVIVSFHWGIEYRDFPSLEQIKLAHLAIDSGADIIIGTHPHWIQPIEIYKGKPIFYSLGNFIFDQNWSTNTKQGIVAKMQTYKNNIVGIEVIPITIGNSGQPSFATSEESKQILDKLKSNSYMLEQQNLTL